MKHSFNTSIIVGFFMGLTGLLTIVATCALYEAGVTVSDGLSSSAPSVEKKFPAHPRHEVQPALPVALNP